MGRRFVVMTGVWLMLLGTMSPELRGEWISGGRGWKYSNADTNFYPWSTACKIGIGTTSPQNNLHVNGGMRWGGDTSAPYTYSDTDGSGFYIETVGSSSANSQMRFQTRDSGAGSYTQFFIDGANNRFNFVNGNVGIGTTSPSEKLEVNGNAKVTGDLWHSNNRIKHWAEGPVSGTPNTWVEICEISGFSGEITVVGRSGSNSGHTFIRRILVDAQSYGWSTGAHYTTIASTQGGSSNSNHDVRVRWVDYYTPFKVEAYWGGSTYYTDTAVYYTAYLTRYQQ